MNLFFKYLSIILILLSSLNGSPPRGGLLTFTQPDGTEFEGYLKGDSVFNWIENDSKVIMYNQKDQFYYNAHLNSKNELEISKEKPSHKKDFSRRQSEFRNSSKKTIKREPHKLSREIKDALFKMQKKSYKGHHSR